MSWNHCHVEEKGWISFAVPDAGKNNKNNLRAKVTYVWKLIDAKILQSNDPRNNTAHNFP